ncbi:MAG TPA: hypothetical protein VFW11_04320 [Cyclobacteriaceae bacterium]|nr:hypothetical protein [Cyclobacteriaceae bacterium]
MEANQLDTLISAKGNPCISVIIPTFRVAPQRMQNQELFRKAMAEARSLLTDKVLSAQNKEMLLARLDNLSEGIDMTHLLDGLGFFVSDGVATKVLFPFPVSEKIAINDSFEIRDLLRMKQFLSPYYILVMGKKIIRLFIANGDVPREILDDHFPLQLEEEYEYSPPSRGTSYGNTLKAFEKDKGILSTIHLRSSLKHVDDILSQYLTEEKRKIVLAGTKTLTNDFENLTTHGENIVATIEGSFRDRNSSELGLTSWAAFSESVSKENDQLLLQFLEQKLNRVVYGIREVWNASNEGRGLILFVEKDYLQPAYLNSNRELELVVDKDYLPVSDAVSELIKSVYHKNGRVVFVDNDKLSNYERIALVLRY